MQPPWSTLCRPELVYATVVVFFAIPGLSMQPSRSNLYRPWLVYATVVVYLCRIGLVYAILVV